MAEPQDAVMPILVKIQDDIDKGFKRADNRFSALDAKVNDIAENTLEIREDIADLRRDILMHLGLTTKHRSDFENLREEVTNLKTRIAALEARS
jgi:polyhydroxyalkanoate synthesis regulator phasin